MADRMLVIDGVRYRRHDARRLGLLEGQTRPAAPAGVLSTQGTITADPAADEPTGASSPTAASSSSAPTAGSADDAGDGDDETAAKARRPANKARRPVNKARAGK